MTFSRSVLTVLALFVAMPAQARGMPDHQVWSGGIMIKKRGFRGDGTQCTEINDCRSLIFKIPPDKAEAAGEAVNRVSGTVKSDAGTESVILTESDAWLHGSAALKALPKYGSTIPLKFTLYRSDRSSLMSFSGSVAADGIVTLTADATKDTGLGTCDATSRTGCSTTSSTSTAPDIELLAAEVFASGNAYELTLDVNGADTYDIASADVTITESNEVTTCTKAGGCTTTGTSTTTKAAIAFDEIASVWEGDLILDHEGVTDIKVKTYDADGNDLSNTKAALGDAWSDGGEGINVLATDEDPLTSVGLLGARVDVLPDGSVKWVSSKLAVSSSGWTATSVPVAAKVELTNGSTVTIPVNSYQRLGRPSYAREGSIAVLSGRFITDQSTITVDGGSIIYDGSSTFNSPIVINGGDLIFHDQSTVLLTRTATSCANGLCATLTENDAGDYELSVAEYGTSLTAMQDEIELGISIADADGDEVDFGSGTVEFDDDITAIFANDVTFKADPLGLDLTGNVSLLGAADSKGKQQTLAKGKFAGSFSRDGDGELTLAGADRDVVASRGDLCVAGKATTSAADAPPLTLVRPLFATSATQSVNIRRTVLATHEEGVGR